MRASSLPNIISTLRILLVPPVVLTMLEQRWGVALPLFLIAGLSDGLDGFLARRYHWTSRLGAILDPIGDKLLMVSSYLVLGWLAILPLWLVVLVILRDVIIMTGTVIYRYFIGIVEFEPILLSKINTICQILLVTLTLCLLAGLEILAGLQTFLIYTVLVTTISSGVAYVILWGRRAMAEKAKSS
ncbi:MAG: CDP-alcohol phosphatidyltransferase family protein [Thiohalomonadales bacterium]|jgi:cardiolipin synthase|nr:CDP-alcohol phosphatidyltransferase family protein [Thiohalomonadales bacterium]